MYRTAHSMKKISFFFFLFLSFFSPKDARTAPPKKVPKDEKTLLLQAPFAVLSFGFQIWHGLLRHALDKPRTEAAVRLRSKKNVEQLERVLKQANQRYLTMLKEELPQEASAHWESLFQKHTDWLSLLEDLPSVFLQAEALSAEQEKRLRSLAQEPLFPTTWKVTLTPKQREILLEAIEIFATSNEMYGYYYVKQRMGCASSKLQSPDPLLASSLRQLRYLQALQKLAKQSSLSSYVYHNALLSRSLFLLPMYCFHPKSKKEKEQHQKAQKKLLHYTHLLQKSLASQSKSFPLLWTLSSSLPSKGVQ